MVNPYGGQVYDVDLSRDAVDGFVFWTRNMGPFARYLSDVRERGPFVVQYTVTGYPRALDAATVDSTVAEQQIRDLADRFGPRVPVWRYDPIVFTSLTPPQWHAETFARLCRGLKGTVDEVVVSVAQIYRKTAFNLTAAARDHGFDWWDPAADEKRALLADLAGIAADHGIETTLCAQPELLADGTRAAACIDARRLSDVAGRTLTSPRRPHRTGCGCGCWQSRDIGDYDTCPHGCAYCYAVKSRKLAKERFSRHDPDGAFLFRKSGK